MNFSCPECASRYFVSNAKLVGRTLKMRCRKCGYLIPIRAEPTRQSMAAAPMIQAESVVPPRPNGAALALGTLWYVAIEGIPVGPLSRGEISSKVFAGSVNERSFVWHQGMAGWAKVPEVASLADLLLPPAPAGEPPTMPPEAKAASSRTPSLQANSAEGTSVRLIGDREAQSVGQLELHSTGDLDSESGSEESPAMGEAGVAESYDDTSESWYPPPRSLLLPTVLAVVAGVVFGVALGFVLFGGETIKLVTQSVEVAMVAKTESGVAPPAPLLNEEEVSPNREDGAEPEKKLRSAHPRNSSPLPKKEDTAAKKEGLKGLAGLGSFGGPEGGPVVSGEGAKGRTALSDAQIHATIAKYRAGVKRGCWERAVMTRSANAPATARVSIAIAVAASGTVTKASAGGDPAGYPGLASCIQRRVSSWSFPRSSDTTEVNVPFVFAAQ